MGQKNSTELVSQESNFEDFPNKTFIYFENFIVFNDSGKLHYRINKNIVNRN